MNQTLNSFKMGQGSVESDQTTMFGGGAISTREKHVGKLQPLNHIKTPKIDSKHFQNETKSTFALPGDYENAHREVTAG